MQISQSSASQRRQEKVKPSENKPKQTETPKADGVASPIKPAGTTATKTSQAKPSETNEPPSENKPSAEKASPKTPVGSQPQNQPVIPVQVLQAQLPNLTLKAQSSGEKKSTEKKGEPEKTGKKDEQRQDMAVAQDQRVQSDQGSSSEDSGQGNSQNPQAQASVEAPAEQKPTVENASTPKEEHVSTIENKTNLTEPDPALKKLKADLEAKAKPSEKDLAVSQQLSQELEQAVKDQKDLSRLNISFWTGKDNIHHPQLQDMNLSGAKLSNANLGGTYMQKVDLSQAELNKAYFHGTKTRGLNLSGSQAQGISLNSSRHDHLNLEGANLEKAKGVGISVNGELNAQGTNLRDANFSRATVDVLKLSGNQFDGLSLRGARINELHLSGADLRNVDLSGVFINRGGTYDSTTQFPPDFDPKVHQLKLVSSPKDALKTHLEHTVPEQKLHLSARVLESQGLLPNPNYKPGGDEPAAVPPDEFFKRREEQMVKNIDKKFQQEKAFVDQHGGYQEALKSLQQEASDKVYGGKHFEPSSSSRLSPEQQEFAKQQEYNLVLSQMVQEKMGSYKAAYDYVETKYREYYAAQVNKGNPNFEQIRKNFDFNKNLDWALGKKKEVEIYDAREFAKEPVTQLELAMRWSHVPEDAVHQQASQVWDDMAEPQRTEALTKVQQERVDIARQQLDAINKSRLEIYGTRNNESAEFQHMGRLYDEGHQDLRKVEQLLAEGKTGEADLLLRQNFSSLNRFDYSQRMLNQLGKYADQKLSKDEMTTAFGQGMLLHMGNMVDAMVEHPVATVAIGGAFLVGTVLAPQVVLPLAFAAGTGMTAYNGSKAYSTIQQGMAANNHQQILQGYQQAGAATLDGLMTAGDGLAALRSVQAFRAFRATNPGKSYAAHNLNQVYQGAKNLRQTFRNQKPKVEEGTPLNTHPGSETTLSNPSEPPRNLTPEEQRNFEKSIEQTREEIAKSLGIKEEPKPPVQQDPKAQQRQQLNEQQRKIQEQQQIEQQRRQDEFHRQSTEPQQSQKSQPQNGHYVDEYQMMVNEAIAKGNIDDLLAAVELIGSKSPVQEPAMRSKIAELFETKIKEAKPWELKEVKQQIEQAGKKLGMEQEAKSAMTKIYTKPTLSPKNMQSEFTADELGKTGMFTQKTSSEEVNQVMKILNKPEYNSQRQALREWAAQRAVGNRQAMDRGKFTNNLAREIAEELGYAEHGMVGNTLVFIDKRGRFISPDLDCHSGLGWKVHPVERGQVNVREYETADILGNIYR